MLKMFLKRDECIGENGNAVMAILNGMYNSKQDVLITSVGLIGYMMTGRFLKSDKSKDRTILTEIRNAIEYLDEWEHIEILDRDKDNYVFSKKGLEIDTREDRFVVVELWEMQKIFSESNRPFNLFLFYVRLLGTINGKTKEWHMSQDTMTTCWKYGKGTVNTYMKQLEEMQLIYIYRHKERRVDGTYHIINNSYGRFADKAAIIAEATTYVKTIETEEMMETLDRRAIKLRYNAFCKGSKTYKDNPRAVEALYGECIKYNESLKYKPIEGSYEEGYQKKYELDLTVFPFPAA